MALRKTLTMVCLILSLSSSSETSTALSAPGARYVVVGGGLLAGDARLRLGGRRGVLAAARLKRLHPWCGPSAAPWFRASIGRMKPRVYIDGHAGTTGLRIREWMARRADVELLTLPDASRKETAARRERLLAADVAVLCLPDDAARAAAQWAAEGATRLIDASTAHRIAAGWVYGLPELVAGQREAIRQARCVANPGCYASAFVLLLRPLLDAGVVGCSAQITCHALSGYSGGGRPMIEKWEDPAGGLRSLVYEAPYALDRVHKHIPEMVRYTGLQNEPYFEPAVGPFRCGMRVQIPLHADLLRPGTSGSDVWEVLHARYRDEPFVRVMPLSEPCEAPEHAFDPQVCNDTNRVELRVLPHPSGHILLLALLDNLGKGAAGAAIQCLNLMLGCDETTGLPA
jgi:N-acetyl-gamma-glutamyl-phosphate reductase